MKELLEYLAKNILTHPDDIQIEEEILDDGAIRLTLITHPEDTGLAIGKSGKTVRALREILKIKAIQTNEKIFLEVRSSEENPE